MNRVINGAARDKSLVVLGGGFGGVTATKRLERTLPPDWQITLLSLNNYITYQPLLPEVVGASVLPGHVVAPLRQIVRRARVCMVTVTGIDTEARQISYLGEGSGIVGYDHLIIACGVEANLRLVEGMASYSLPLKTLGDALFLRNRIVVRLEQAELQPNDELRRWLTSFVVVGGGFSGVETAGELIDFIYASLRYYPRIHRDDIRITLLHSSDRLLPELSPGLGQIALKKMQSRGLEARLNARAVRVDDRAVYLDNGAVIQAGTVICTIGTIASSLVQDLPVATQRGRLVTNADLSVAGLEHVWAIGDCALVPNAYDDKPCPPTAQFAERQARTLARNIVAKTRGRATTAFSYRPMGQLASIGHNNAVAEILGIRVSGFIAWLMWRGLFLLRIPTLGRKVRLYLEWNWAMFFPPDTTHFSFARTKRKPKVVVNRE
jgi:NADH dehydrogenase